MVKAYIGAKPYSSFLRYALSSTLNFETDGNRRTLQCDEERGLTTRSRQMRQVRSHLAVCLERAKR